MENGSRKNDALSTTNLDYLIGIRIKAENSNETAEVARAEGVGGSRLV